MAKKKKNRKKSKKRAAASKARGKKKVSKKNARKRHATKNTAAKRARLSRGLDSGRAALIPQSEPERTLAAGQSGDVQGLSEIEDAESESVEELAEEGQDYEAEIVGGVERAADRQEKEVRTDVTEEERPRPKRHTL